MQTVQDDELHIVVALRGEQLAVCVGGGTHRGGRRREGHERPRTLIDDGGAGRREEGDDNLDVPPLVGWGPLGAADLADEVDGGHLQEIGPLRDAVGVGEEVRDGAVLRAGEEHEEGVPARGGVLLGGEGALDELQRVGDELVPCWRR